MTCDPLRVFLEQHAASSRVLFTSDEVQATLYALRDGTQVVLKATSPDRADFEWKQVANEVKAARSLPDCSCLGHQVAWKAADDGAMLSVSLYAGRTVEALLQEPCAAGGWADLQLWQRVDVVRDLLAGGVQALMRMRPWLHFDVKPANVAVMPCPAGGPPHVTLLDMGAVTHIAALHTPQRSTMYPVVSPDHMDVALITMQPGQVQLPYETKQGCRDALSHTTDLFTLGLLAYKVLLGPQLPPDMDWDSSHYEPWDSAQEMRYVAAQQRLASDLAAGGSKHASTQAVLQQLPQDCLQALGRMCDPDPASRADLQEAASPAFIQQRLGQLAVYSTARDAAYAAARQQLINLLRDVPDIQLAARPSSGRHSNSGGDSAVSGAPVSRGSRGSSSSNCLPQPEVGEGERPPGAFHRLPPGTNAAREAAAAAAATAAAQLDQQHQRNQQQQRTEFGLGRSGPPGFPCKLGQAAQSRKAFSNHHHSSAGWAEYDGAQQDQQQDDCRGRNRGPEHELSTWPTSQLPARTSSSDSQAGVRPAQQQPPPCAGPHAGASTATHVSTSGRQQAGPSWQGSAQQRAGRESTSFMQQECWGVSQAGTLSSTQSQQQQRGWQGGSAFGDGPGGHHSRWLAAGMLPASSADMQETASPDCW